MIIFLSTVYLTPDMLADVFLNEAVGNWVDYTLANTHTLPPRVPSI